MSYPSSRSTVRGREWRHLKKREKGFLHSREFLPRVPKSRASKRKETLEVGLVEKRADLAKKLKH